MNGAPTGVSIGGQIWHEWSILAVDGILIPLEFVQGDSGAWVLRNGDNKLMGQINEYFYGRRRTLPAFLGLV